MSGWGVIKYLLCSDRTIGLFLLVRKGGKSIAWKRKLGISAYRMLIAAVHVIPGKHCQS